MTVKELINKLQEFPPNTPIHHYNDNIGGYEEYTNKPELRGIDLSGTICGRFPEDYVYPSDQLSDKRINIVTL